MQNKDYVDRVNSGNFPEEVQVPIDEPFRDARGEILNVWLGSCGSATYITSKKGSVRAKHIHLNDWHGCFMISGEVQYTEKDDLGNITHQKIYKAGEQFFSRPGIWHEMLFLEDSQMMTFNGIIKNHENYEKSIIRTEM